MFADVLNCRRAIGIGVALYLLSFVTTAWAAVPEVVVISPPGVQRGTATEITLTGARLGDTKQILFFTPGIEVTNIQSPADNVVKATVTVPADFPCDLHAFRVYTASGLSNLRYLSVGALPVVNEAEPNSEFATPQSIAMNSTVHGVVLTEDVDYFSVELKKGERLAVELEGLRLSYMYDFFDPFVAILDSKRFELARSDDMPLVQQDGVCSIVAPEDGKYIVEVRESSFGGNERALYRLHVGSFPRPLAMYPAGGMPGQKLDLTCVDRDGNSWQQTVTLPETPTSVFKAWSERDGQIAPSPNYLRVVPYANVLEVAENDDPTKVPVAESTPIAFNGILEKAGDRDWFAFAAKKDQVLEIRAIARGTIRSPVDGVITIQKVGGGQLAANDDSGGPDAFISFRVPEDGNYAVSMQDHLLAGGPHYVYRIEVAPPQPEVATSVNELERWVSQVVNVPAGARMAVEANLVRRNVGGAGSITSPDLPPGMTLHDTPVSADLTMVPLMLHASADAPQQGKLIDLVASLPLTPEQMLVGHLEQRNQIIRGQNNVDVWGYNGNRLAVAVTEPAPFDIQVVPPQVPLVRDGSMNLVVKATRKPGFDKPINLRLLSAPPGVGASGSVVIPGDQSEAVIPMTANGGATIRVWPITVLATTDLGRGPITIASEFVQLDVQDSLFEFQFSKTVAEQGKSADILVGVKAKRAFEGIAEIEVLGLPPGTSTTQAKVQFAEGMERLSYPLTVPAEVRQGNYKTVVCRAVIKSEKGEITQTNGAGEVQVDIPLPAPASVAVAPMPAPTPAAPAAPVEKPLSRLEQLRQMREAARGK